MLPVQRARVWSLVRRTRIPLAAWCGVEKNINVSSLFTHPWSGSPWECQLHKVTSQHISTHLSFLLYVFALLRVSSVQLLFATPWTAACQASLSFTNYRSLLKLMSIETVMPSNHLILCRPLLLLPSIFPRIRVFSTESVLCIRWPKYRSFSFSISPSNEYSGLISFRMDWLDLLVVEGTLKNLFQHHSSKASILRC